MCPIITKHNTSRGFYAIRKAVWYIEEKLAGVTNSHLDNASMLSRSTLFAFSSLICPQKLLDLQRERDPG